MVKKSNKRISRQLKDLPLDTTYIFRVTEWAADGGYSHNRKPSRNNRLGPFWTLQKDGSATHESLGLWLRAFLIDPHMEGVENVDLTLHRIWSEPGGGHLDRTGGSLHGFFFLPESTILCLLTSLGSRAEILLQCMGTRLFRRKAILDHFEWYTGNHPSILAEIDAIKQEGL